MAAIERGWQDRLYLGNLDAKRDWGHARDYVEGMWCILQQDSPDDYVLATGETHTVREFVELAFGQIGRPIEWRGEGDNEQGCCRRTGRRAGGDRRHLSPADRRSTFCWATPPRRWPSSAGAHRTSFPDLVAEMVEADRLVMKRMGANNAYEPKLYAAQ